MFLAACKGGEDSTKKGENEKGSNNPSEETGKAQMGGTITGAMDTAPAGVFNPIFYTDAYESNILSFTHESLVTQNEKLEFLPSLAKEWKFNDDQTEVTFTLQDNVKWHDGKPFTANDVVFTYKSIASPGYVEAGGVRTEYVEKLLGYEDFNSGKTDQLEGVVAQDEHTVTFKFSEPNVTALDNASFPIIPEHIFKDIPIKDMPKAGATLNAGEVIGTGPFKFTKMIEGEQYILEKNKDYWQGEPYLDQIVWKVVNQSVIVGMLETGELDFVADPNGFQPADYDSISALDNIEIIEQPKFGYQLMGFMVNHRTPEDVKAGVIKPENWVSNKKIADKRVRQAIAYAVDREGLIKALLHGRGAVINAPIATQFSAYDGEKPNQYKFNVEEAKKLLDEAGYVDKDNDGFREDPDGKKWVLTLNYPTGNELRMRSAPIIQEMLEAVGIKIDLRQPIEFSTYSDVLEKDSDDWDLYLLGWSLSSTDPDPSGLWGSKAAYNYGRWNNKESDELMKKAVQPPEAFDQAYRDQVYSDWQVLFQDDLPALILYAQNTLWGYNKRLQNVKPLPYSMYNDTHLWWVSSK
ncbi:MAG: peptide-binding protein [Heyndrickxia oleronia]|jgi:peptide/nickel transport system substrate-binding protein|nr:peptide-binding protein [Heyndrickxia oleronia]MCI1590806.1 peptide-binding protein [Heyndrickxia oleronia]MCI1612837.1 peptide-binding protein [Heyndrickxia oleronia]MCI1744063.1 peptide-binding protein [Heyndrickxia oleronia]MCI1761654.1 peptide-binding protein [Heyndrickxia oleronia]